MLKYDMMKIRIINKTRKHIIFSITGVMNIINEYSKDRTKYNLVITQFIEIRNFRLRMNSRSYRESGIILVNIFRKSIFSHLQGRMIT